MAEPKWSDLPLWPHQRSAIDLVLNYLSSGESRRSALVRMPTGTGKSGIIAVLSTHFEELSHVLVVTPHAPLRDQLADDIRADFWTSMNVPVPTKPVKTLVPSEATKVLNDTTEHGVYVCTIQALHALYRNSHEDSAFNLIRDRVSLVIFDEGHREPAPKWTKAIQALEKPTVLLSATPYRNDHKFIAVHSGFSLTLPFQQALDDNYIRDVFFHEEPFRRTPESFVQALLSFYGGEFQQRRPLGLQPKVIVRCETRYAVDAIHTLLLANGEKSVAIHDTFRNDDDTERYRTVPSPKKTDAVFWVHQNKLIEGIDDPSFCLLALYQPLRNARSLVQQIGRVIRNPQQAPGQLAQVFCHPNDGQKEYWQNYLRYEAQDQTVDLLDLLESLPVVYQYFEGDYRQTFDLNSADAFKRTASVFTLNDDFLLDTLVNEMLDEWAVNERNHLNHQETETNTGVIVYLKYGNSPVLSDSIFLEFRLGFSVYRLIGGTLFFYDSEGTTPEYLREHGRRLSPAALQKLFTENSRVSQISLVNSDLGRTAIRRRTLHARSVAESAPSLADYAHVCSTAAGSVSLDGDRSIRRYVGFTRARVSDFSRHGVTYDEFIKWTDSIASALATTGTTRPALFNRYSTYSEPPSDPTPLNILLDLDEAQEIFAKIGIDKTLHVEDLCLPIEQGKFTVRMNGVDYSVAVSYDTKRREYTLSCEELDRAYTHIGQEIRAKHEGLISFLNRNQSFRLVVDSGEHLYVHGHFFKTMLGLAGELDLTRIFTSSEALVKTTSEKGPKGSSKESGWHQDSVFHLIDSRGEGTNLYSDMRNIEYLVCDDFSSEIADFIGVDETGKRVVFIHAKHGGGAERSASVWAEICGQAVKNLGYVQPFPSTVPLNNILRWNGSWTHEHYGTVDRRMRSKGITGEAMWDKVLEMVRNPDTSREVWLVLGQGFSAKKFEENRNKRRKPPETIQIYHQLTATWAAVSSVGAKLRVFCSP
jgi:superfamily II DNA or RNA helicase